MYHKFNTHNRLFNNFGLSVVELMISLSLMAIILIIGYNFLAVNYRAYQTGEALSEVQFDTRMASDFIFFELKNARSISLTDSSLAKMINLSTLKTNYPRITAVNFSIVQSGNLYLVNYIITTSHANLNSDYKLQSEVLLNNIKNATTGSGNLIYYSQ